MRRPGYFELAHRNNGWVVRWKGGNHVTALSSGDQLYATRRNAVKAVLSVARGFWEDGFDTVTLLPLAGGLYLSNGDGDYVQVRIVDERDHA